MSAPRVVAAVVVPWIVAEILGTVVWAVIAVRMRRHGRDHHPKPRSPTPPPSPPPD